MSASSTPYLLEMLDIDKRFPGVHALDRVQFRLRPGSVHALMGENGAGKSTLMKCLFGIYKKDAGRILLSGQEVSFENPRHALNQGVAMVHQELNQVLKRSVMENLWLGRLPLRRGLVDTRRMVEDSRRVFDELNIDVDPRTIIGTLSVAKRQMVEIAKAVSYNAKILVLDEPTSSLTENEVTHLFGIIRKLAASGVGIIYISHKMDEIMQISDEITVMRDGQWVDTRPAKEMDEQQVIRLMVNRDLTHRFPKKENTPGEPLLKVEGLSGRYEPACREVSFQLRRGEVLGIAGLVGSRRSELLNTLFGVYTRGGGTILHNGRPIANRSPREARRNRFALITEERRATGLFPAMNIAFNSTIANVGAYGRVLLSNRRMSRDTQWVIDSLSVKTPAQRTAIRSLSGGNQQKVIIGRWLLTDPEILLMDEPTRGIDVGAKFEIYQLILNLAGEGKGIIMVSSEMPELIGICDRILVMSNGRMAGILERGTDFGGVEHEQENILRLAAKYM